MKGLRILIVDDEQPARTKIRSFLKQEECIDTVLETSNGIEAVNTIQNEILDLVFLDIQMPGMNGFQVIETIGVEAMPAVVFVTAYDQYAIHAFEVQAVDYLLKPFDKERFQKAFQRTLNLMQIDKNYKVIIKGILQEIQKNTKYSNRIMVNVQGRYIFINTNDIFYLSTEGNYVQLHTKQDNYLIHSSLSSMEEKLDPSKFVRIHRFFLVNIDYIKEIQPWSHGDAIVILKSGYKLSLSRRFRDRLFDIK